MGAVCSDAEAARCASLNRAIEPVADGWLTEEYHEAAIGQLKSLLKLVQKPDQLSAAALEKFAAADCACRLLRPAKLATAFQDTAFTVQRGLTSEDVSALRGPAGLA